MASRAAAHVHRGSGVAPGVDRSVCPVISPVAHSSRHSARSVALSATIKECCGARPAPASQRCRRCRPLASPWWGRGRNATTQSAIRMDRNRLARSRHASAQQERSSIARRELAHQRVILDDLIGCEEMAGCLRGIVEVTAPAIWRQAWQADDPWGGRRMTNREVMRPSSATGTWRTRARLLRRRRRRRRVYRVPTAEDRRDRKATEDGTGSDPGDPRVDRPRA